MADQHQQRTQDRKQRLEDDKQRVNQDREQRYKEQEEQRASHRGTPTPTQEENDLLNLGHHVELAKDGSEEDRNVGFTQRQLEGERGSERGGDYKTRRSEPQQHGGSGSQHRESQPSSQPHTQQPHTQHTSPRPPENK
jgi:hypothetical protein